MNEKVQAVIDRYEELSSQLGNPEIINNPSELRKFSIEQSDLTELYTLSKKIEQLVKESTEAEQILSTEADEDAKQFYSDLISSNNEQLSLLESEFVQLNTKKDPNDRRNAFLEIRAGTGGEEAALFASDLYRMYIKFAEKEGWSVEQISSANSENGGFKEVIFAIKGNGVFGKLKYESGVHRVQRVPATESSGRIHTSAASVVVLPEVEDVEIEVKDEDLKIDVYRSSGPGGQSVNTTDSAVRITHIPTGIVVTCQDEKSQLKNKHKALRVLKSRLYDMEMQRKEEAERGKRQSAIAGGDRSAKIRTYNYPQSRITDHRIKVSWHNLNEILSGELEEVISTISEKLSES